MLSRRAVWYGVALGVVLGVAATGELGGAIVIVLYAVVKSVMLERFGVLQR